ncbi:hypothetical protein Sgou_42700 [Streptomyces gougerotii]|uniref:Uncharacterized protein n=1 Tax=Streptomyces gougerotii TaxID=53448 RepID=A0A8H9HCS0_9ACTN|nr:hypothetical protein Sgou_42700 [Streptomyces gougerotii]GGU52563.1 hypothetical protein GCM10010227_01490 [Streptomyces gougerotii]
MWDRRSDAAPQPGAAAPGEVSPATGTLPPYGRSAFPARASVLRMRYEVERPEGTAWPRASR